MNKIKQRKILYIIFFATIFSILLCHSFTYLDPDFGWHLKIGQETIQEKSVPTIEKHVTILRGASWVDHEWLLNAAVYWFYDKLGYIPLSIFFAALALIFFILTIILARDNLAKGSDSTIFIILFVLLGLPGILGHLGVRLQEIGFLCFVLILLMIRNYENQRNWKILMLFPPFFILWANMHGSFLVGLFILLLWLGVMVLRKIFEHRKFVNFRTETFFVLPAAFSRRQIWTFALFVLLSFAATLLTPYGLKLHYFLADYWRNPAFSSQIQEWLSPFQFPFRYWQIFYISFFLGALFFFFFYRIITEISASNKIKLNFWYLLLSLIFIVLTLKSRRNFPFFFAVSLPIMVGFFSGIFDFNLDYIHKVFLTFPRFVKNSPVVIILLVLTLTILRTNFNSNPFQNYCSEYPCQALDYIKSKPEYKNLKIFNSYQWGGYLLWTWPEKEIFVDGRYPQHSLGSRSLIEEYADFFDSDKGLEKFSQYDIQLVLASRNNINYSSNWLEKIIFRIKQKDIDKMNISNSLLFLQQSDKYSLVYADEVADIYVLKNIER